MGYADEVLIQCREWCAEIERCIDQRNGPTRPSSPAVPPPTRVRDLLDDMDDAILKESNKVLAERREKDAVRRQLIAWLEPYGETGLEEKNLGFLVERLVTMHEARLARLREDMFAVCVGIDRHLSAMSRLCGK